MVTSLLLCWDPWCKGWERVTLSFCLKQRSQILIPLSQAKNVKCTVGCWGLGDLEPLATFKNTMTQHSKGLQPTAAVLGGGGDQRPSGVIESYFLKARNPDSLFKCWYLIHIKIYFIHLCVYVKDIHIHIYKVQGIQTDTFGAIYFLACESEVAQSCPTLLPHGL